MSVCTPSYSFAKQQLIDKGSFNNYVDKMEGSEKMCVFVHAQGIKTVHVVVE